MVQFYVLGRMMIELQRRSFIAGLAAVVAAPAVVRAAQLMPVKTPAVPLFTPKLPLVYGTSPHFLITDMVVEADFVVSLTAVTVFHSEDRPPIMRVDDSICRSKKLQHYHDIVPHRRHDAGHLKIVTCGKYTIAEIKGGFADFAILRPGDLIDIPGAYRA